MIYGKNTMLPYLLDRGITCVDYVMCSHFDTDHVGALKYILENIKVKNIIISKQKEEYENFKEIMEIAIQKKVNIIIVKAGDTLNIEKNVYFEILYPSRELKHSDINNNSIVARLVYNNIKILFTRRYWKRSRRKFANDVWKRRVGSGYIKNCTPWIININKRRIFTSSISQNCSNWGR